MPAETPAERGRRLVDGHDDGHDDLDDADDDDDHDDDHDGSARRVDRITRPRRSRVSSVCGRSGTPPAVRNAAAGPSTRWCRTARRGSHPRQRRERYCSRVREPRLAFGSLRYMPAAAAAGSFLYIGVFQQSCRPAYGSPSRFSGVNVLGASAPPVISTCRVNTPVRRGLGMSRSAPPNAYPKGCTACTAGCSSEAPYDRALVGVAVGVGAYRRQPRGTVGAARAAERPLTEWVNVIAFSDRTRHLSSQFDKSQMIAVMGKSRWSRTRPGRASPRSAGRLTPRISSRTRARPAERAAPCRYRRPAEDRWTRPPPAFSPSASRCRRTAFPNSIDPCGPPGPARSVGRSVLGPGGSRGVRVRPRSVGAPVSSPSSPVVGSGVSAVSAPVASVSAVSVPSVAVARAGVRLISSTFVVCTSVR